MSAAWRGAVVLLSFAACGAPAPGPTKQPLDPVPGQFLEALRGGDGGVAFTLCAQDVAFFASDVEVHGVAGVQDAVSKLGVPPAAIIDKHHGVARLTLGDGSTLFVRSDDAGHVTEVVRFPAGTNAETPSSLVAYQDAWNVDASGRAPLLKSGWTAASRYLDPTAEGIGPEGLSKVIDALRAQFPGSRLDAAPGVQRVTGGWVTFDWVLTSSSSELHGFDVARVDEAGTPAFIAGFFSSR